MNNSGAANTSNTPNIPATIERFKSVLHELDSKTGELAEVKKAEIDAFKENFRGDNVTHARENAKMAAGEFTKEVIDLQCDIDSLLRWRDFYTLILKLELG